MMIPSTSTNQRNLTLECCKLLASCFVVFIHVPFPWPAGEFILCLARFAVPMFFAISGWYSYRADSRKLLRRMGHMLLLELVGIGIMQLWRIAAAIYTGQDPLTMLRYSLPDAAMWKLWLLFNEDPFGGQLWYLSASAFAYGVLWLYSRLVKTKGYRPLYLVSVLLLAAHFAMGELSRFTGLTVFFKIPRSGLFYGLPMFILGLFLREHRDALLEKLSTPKLTLLMLLGTGLTIGEWQYFGVYDLYLGLLICVPALLLLTARHPQVPRWLRSAATHFGPVSTTVYLVHMAMLDIYLGFFQWRVARYFGAAEPWLQPLGVLALSLAAAIAWELLGWIRKKGPFGTTNSKGGSV